MHFTLIHLLPHYLFLGGILFENYDMSETSPSFFGTYLNLFEKINKLVIYELCKLQIVPHTNNDAKSLEDGPLSQALNHKWYCYFHVSGAI